MELDKQQPVVFLNTVPKSGTNLLNQIVHGFPGSVMEPTVFYEGTETDTHWQFPLLRQALPNQIYMGHVYHSSLWADFLRNEPIRTIFMIRDLRDVVVSLAYYIVKHVPNYPVYPDLIALQSQQERYLLLINGLGEYPSIRQWFELFAGWLHEPGVLTVTYEELMASPASRTETILRIASHIWKGQDAPLPIEELAALMEDNIRAESSFTFRKGIVGGWKEEFDDEVKQRFKEVAGDLLVQTGYEKDNNW